MAISANTHVALLPSSGMGHLSPFLRFAAVLAAHGCVVTVITPYPMVSSSESRYISNFFSAFPHIRPLEFYLLPFDPTNAGSSDPFFLQFEAIRRSIHLLPSLLSSASPPFSALITDIPLVSSVAHVPLPCPNYLFFTSCASMLAFCAYFSTTAASSSGYRRDIEIPGLPSTIPYSSIPPVLHNPNDLFTTQFTENGRAVLKVDEILINSFHALEPETFAALNGRGKVVAGGLPPVSAVGPLELCEFERCSKRLCWLDEQPVASVVYVSFGSRNALSIEQMKELGHGLEKSGCRFLWVVKSKVVDKDDAAVGLGELLCDDFLERVKNKGLVVKDWVNQWEVLGHPAVAGFISHCGWNSVNEAAWQGVPVLAWPQGGDQKINAEVMEKSGMGIWMKEWGWAREKLVMADEIGQRVRELMEDERLRARAVRVREGARRAVAAGGTSNQAIAGLIKTWIDRRPAGN